MNFSPRISRAGIPLLAVLLALPALAQEPAGSVTGSFGDQSLEMTVAGELSGAMIVGDFVEASLLAVQNEGEPGPINLELIMAGDLPDPDDVTLTITFARDMGQNWTGNQENLTLCLDDVAPGDSVVAFKSTLTVEVTGGPASECRSAGPS